MRCSPPPRETSWSRPGTTATSSSLCRLLDLSGLAGDPQYAHNADRVANRAALHEVLEQRFGEKSAAEWEALLGAESIPCSRVRSVADLVHDPQLEALAMLVDLPHPDIPDLRVVDIPLTVDGQRTTHRHPPPRLGQQTTAILEELGVPAEEIDRLLSERVVSR